MDITRQRPAFVHPDTLDMAIRGRQSRPDPKMDLSACRYPLPLECFPASEQSWQDLFPDYKDWLDRCSPQEVLEIFKAARALMTQIELISNRVRGSRFCLYGVNSDVLIVHSKQELGRLIEAGQEFIDQDLQKSLSYGEPIIKHLLAELDAKVSDFEKFSHLLYGKWIAELPEANEPSESCQLRVTRWSEATILTNKMLILKSLIDPESGDETDTFSY